MTSAPTSILAPNPSVMTGPGTNTYLCGGRGQLVCIDPGPQDDAHLEAILAAATRLNGRITTILVSHSHPDHRSLAASLGQRTGAPVRCLDPSRVDDGAVPIVDGDTVVAGDIVLEVVHTPGHAADHACFFERVSGVLYSGDHILGGMTSVVAPPDGDMSVYMASLDRIRRLHPSTILPGHGPRIDDAGHVVDEYIAHRQEREQQVLAALRDRGSAAHAADLVPTIYADYPRELWPFAAQTVEAHLDKLARDGVAVREATTSTPAYTPAGGSISSGA